jgi:hypothetical protein
VTPLGRRSLRALQSLMPSSRDGLVILLYHLVGAGTDSPVDLPATTFRRHMEELQDAARVVPLGEALKSLRGVPANGGTTVVVTFDDAYENFVSHALPVLEELAIPATLYIPVGFVDRTSPAPISATEHLPPASWPALRTAIGSGLVTPGSHTLTHPDLRSLPRDEGRAEVVRSREILAERLGAEVETFAYPRALAPRWLSGAVRRHYRTAVVDGGVKIRRGGRWDPHALPRTPIRRDGPARLDPILRTPVWLEEWLASRLRRLRRPRGAPAP